MQDTDTGSIIFLKVKETISTLGLDFKILKGVTIDRGRQNYIGNWNSRTNSYSQNYPPETLCGKSAPIWQYLKL